MKRPDARAVWPQHSSRRACDGCGRIEAIYCLSVKPYSAHLPPLTYLCGECYVRETVEVLMLIGVRGFGKTPDGQTYIAHDNYILSESIANALRGRGHTND